MYNGSLILNDALNQTNSSITKDTTLNFTLEELPVGNYNFSINCTDHFNNIGESDTYGFSVVKNTDFSGNTTDLTQIDVSNISNLIIEESNSGMINFSEDIDLSGGGDINQYVNISLNRIEVDSDTLNSLNKPARLSFYNIDYDDPRPVKDNSACSSTICTEVNYSENTYIYDVTGFSVYSVEETPSTDVSTVTATTAADGGGHRANVEEYKECESESDC